MTYSRITSQLKQRIVEECPGLYRWIELVEELEQCIFQNIVVFLI